MQLTGTNRSIGLIALIFSVHDLDVIAGLDPAIHRNKRRIAFADRGPRVEPEDGARSLRAQACFVFLVLRRPGGSSEELEPDPIPNSAVKLLSANGTMA